jgi:hypothetical protein
MYMKFIMLGKRIYIRLSLMPEPSLLEVEIAIGKLKSYKSWIPTRFQPN